MPRELYRSDCVLNLHVNLQPGVHVRGRVPERTARPRGAVKSDRRLS